MLVISRKSGEEIVIGDDVRITVVAVRGKRVKLGITGPIEIPVRRGELEERPQKKLAKGAPAPPSTDSGLSALAVG